MIHASRFNEPRQANLSAVIGAIRDGVNLRGAACAGPLAWLWDADLDGVKESTAQKQARHEQARAICRSCPVKAICRAQVDTDPRLAIGSSVWGGDVISWPGIKVEPGASVTATPQELTACRGCGAPVASTGHGSTGHGSRYCSTKCRPSSQAKARRRKEQRRAGGTPPALTHCKQCRGPLSELQQQRRRELCSDDCIRAADRERKRVAAARRAA